MTAWYCDFPACGHVWYTAKEPLRCAKCKRKNWNKTGGDVIKAPKTRKKVRKLKPSPDVKLVTSQDGKLIIRTEDGVATSTLVLPEPTITSVTILSPGYGYESPYAGPIPVAAPVLPTIIHAPVAERFQEALKQIAEPEHKIGEKCKHGWANWLQCEKCNPKVAQ